MHFEWNMIGGVPAHYNVSLACRYFRLAKHRKPGRIVKNLLGIFIVIQIMLGVWTYG